LRLPLSADNGSTSTYKNDGLTNNDVRSFAILGSYLFSGTAGGGVYRSSNNGSNWEQINNGLTNNDVRALAVSGNNIFAGTYGNGVFISSNNGTIWTQVNNGLADTSVNALTVNGDNIYAGVGTYLGGGVFLSKNNGTNWNQLLVLPRFNCVTTLVANQTNIFAGTTTGGVFRASLNDTNWSQVNNGIPGSGLNWPSVPSLITNGSVIFAATISQGVFLSKNNGTDWIPVGLTGTEIEALVVCGNNLFAGLNYDGVWSRPLSELSANNKEVNDLPKDFSLSQNYPNPFNPGTVISYSIPSASNIKLTVYNTLGQSAKVLETGYKQSGNYSITFNASALPSGIYFYKLEAGNFSQIKKMILIK